MNRLILRGFVTLFTFVCMACGRTGSSGAAVVTSSDSSAIVGTSSTVDGVTTIDFPADAFDHAAKFIVDTTPIAIIGGANGAADYDLTWAHAPIILPGGGYAALVSIGGGKLMIFDGAGKGERTFGKLGQGPGEFTRPAGPILLGGDTLLIPDDANRRFNYFLPDKGLVATVAMVFPAKPAFRMTEPIGRVDSKHLVWYSGVLREEDTLHISRPPIPIGISAMNYDSVKVIDSVIGFELTPAHAKFFGRARTYVTLLRFGRMSSFALWDTTIAIGTGADGFVVDQIDRAGHLVRRIRVASTRRAVTQAMRDAQNALDISQMQTRGEGGDAVSAADMEDGKRRIRETPTADSLPPYGRFFAAPGGILWVMDAVAPTDTVMHATAFRADGAIIGRMSLPASMRPQITFGADRLAIRSLDDDGVVSFKVFRFRLAK